MAFYGDVLGLRSGAALDGADDGAAAAGRVFRVGDGSFLQLRLGAKARPPTLISRPQAPHNPGFLTVILPGSPGMRSIHPHK